jgi:acylphosphatase
MKKSIRLFITGTVQGVFFRKWAKEEADKLGVRGHVRNLSDGRVEIFIEGDQVVVDDFAAICKEGPKYAKIRSVEEKEERFQDFKDFKIIYI